MKSLLLITLFAVFSIPSHADNLFQDKNPFSVKHTFTDRNPVYNNPVKAVHKVKVRWLRKANSTRKTDIPNYYKNKCDTGAIICVFK